MQAAEAKLGRGIITPFRRQGGDFANAVGVPVVESALKQILKTRKGDLRWRQNFGIDIDNYRHRNINNAMLAELEAAITSQIQTYEPRIEILNIEVQQQNPESTVVRVRLKWRAINKKRMAGAGTVLTDEQTTEVLV